MVDLGVSVGFSVRVSFDNLMLAAICLPLVVICQSFLLLSMSSVAVPVACDSRFRVSILSVLA